MIGGMAQGGRGIGVEGEKGEGGMARGARWR